MRVCVIRVNVFILLGRCFVPQKRVEKVTDFFVCFSLKGSFNLPATTLQGDDPKRIGTGAVEDSAGQLEGGWFRTTQWTDLLQAKDRAASEVARQGLTKICESYWPPIYGYLRRFGYSRPDAEDLTQGFFEHLL